MTMSGKELVKILERNGWKTVRICGSHHTLRRGSQTVTVPVHGNTDLGKGLLEQLLKATGLK